MQTTTNEVTTHYDTATTLAEKLGDLAARPMREASDKAIQRAQETGRPHAVERDKTTGSYSVREVEAHEDIDELREKCFVAQPFAA